MLNWIARYAPVRDFILDDDGRPRTSLLDVGCGPHGLACAFPAVPFVGTDVLFPHQVAPTMVGVRSRPGPLPFADGAFGTVLCLDVFEHIPAPERAPFVAELARVAAERVILACPSDEAQPFDDFVRGQFGGAVPDWLAEHYECGLPSVAEIERCVRGVPGFDARPLPTSNGLLALLTVLGELLPQFIPAATREYDLHRDRWVELFAGATFGDSPRKAWAIERVEARRPLVGPDCPRGDVAAALRCPDCGAAHRDLTCTGCGRPVTTDAAGAWDLATGAAPLPPASARLDTDAATILWLTPDWERAATWVPALEAYIARSRAADDCCLVVEGIGEPRAGELLEHACAQLAAGGDFGDVLLVSEPVERPQRAWPVDGRATITRALASPVA